jgi:hypothetical protein
MNSEMSPELAQENCQVVNLVQSLLGLVTPNLRCVNLETREDGHVCVWFVVERDDPSTREDVEDIVGDFDALQMGTILSHELLVDARPRHEIRVPGRPVYWRKEEVAGSD